MLSHRYASDLCFTLDVLPCEGTVTCMDEAAVGCVVLEGFRSWLRRGCVWIRLFEDLCLVCFAFGGRGGAHHAYSMQRKRIWVADCSLRAHPESEDYGAYDQAPPQVYCEQTGSGMYILGVIASGCQPEGQVWWPRWSSPKEGDVLPRSPAICKADLFGSVPADICVVA